MAAILQRKAAALAHPAGPKAHVVAVNKAGGVALAIHHAEIHGACAGKWCAMFVGQRGVFMIHQLGARGGIALVQKAVDRHNVWANRFARAHERRAIRLRWRRSRACR